MTELLTAAQMRAIEIAAIEAGEVTGLELMERAGRGVVEAVFAEWPELAKTSHKAMVLCGPGNNGGDGFVVARLLREWGWQVEVFLFGEAQKLPPDARANFERWQKIGAVYEGGDFGQRNTGLMPDLFVDAVFGIGLVRPLKGEISKAMTGLEPVCRAIGARSVAVDIPSGICSDSGRVLGVVAARVNLTVTFHRAKLAHVLSQGPAHSGKVVVHDIGLETAGTGRIIQRVTAPMSGVTTKATGHHKYNHGHALILSGPSGKGGAARLAARGALRIGAGLVSVGCPPDAVAEHAARMDAMMLCAIHDGDALARVLADKRINALCLGPGLGLERARELVPVALAAGPACVLDADALTAYANKPSELFDMLHENCIITPHDGEFFRLFPDIAKRLSSTPTSGPTSGPAYSRAEATCEAAARAGCVVLLKGADTVIAAPDGQCAINVAAYERAAPWLATAGSGDVLAGFITGLLARGFGPIWAAKAAAWLHVECALSFGPGLISEDIPDQLPKVFKRLEVESPLV